MNTYPPDGCIWLTEVQPLTAVPENGNAYIEPEKLARMSAPAVPVTACCGCGAANALATPLLLAALGGFIRSALVSSILHLKD